MVTITDYLQYVSLTVFPSVFSVLFLSYEIVESRKTKRNVIFRLKRLFGRFWFAFMFVAGFLLIFKMFALFSSDEYILISAFIITGLILMVLTLQFKQFFDDLLSGEW